MSIKLKHAVIFDKKNSQSTPELDFNADERDYNFILAENLRDQKYLSNIFLGKKIVKTGEFKIDDNNKANKFWIKKHVVFIKDVKSIFSFMSIRESMYLSLLFNRDFFVHAKSEYIKKRYDLMSFKSAKLNKTDLETREKIDKMIARFIKSVSEIENDWINEFRKQMNLFHERKINEVYSDASEYAKILLKEYTDLDEINWINNLYETFLESLWDKVYSFMDIVSSCHCEYNAVSSKNKAIRRLHKELDFHQHQFIVKKYLKQIEVRIADLKKTTFRNKFALKSLRNRILVEIEKSEHGLRKRVIKELESWRKLTVDQHVEFSEKQERVFFSNLTDDAMNIRGKIVEVMHAYHQKVLTNSTEKMEIDAAKVELEKLKQDIKSVREQALDWTDDLMQKLGISYDWKHKNNHKVRLNRIYFKLLQMFYNKKHNIIFQNTFSKLSRDESEKLINVLDKLKELDHKLTVIFIENDYRNIPRLKSNGYKYHNGVLFSFDLERDFIENTEDYNETIFYKYNKLQFKVQKGSSITLSGQKVKLKNEVKESDSVVLINPFLIKTDKKNSKNPIITYNIKGVKSNPFKDHFMHLGVSTMGNKLFYYSDNNEGINSIVIDEDSIIKTL